MPLSILPVWKEAFLDECSLDPVIDLVHCGDFWRASNGKASAWRTTALRTCDYYSDLEYCYAAVGGYEHTSGSGILPILSLVCFEAVMSWITLKSIRIRRIVSGRPKIIIRDGKLEQATIRDLRLSVDEVMMSLRQNDVFDISQVQYAIMETTGSISVYLKPEFQPLTQGISI